MKLRTFLLALLTMTAICSSAQDSDNLLNVIRGKQVKSNLGGKAGVIFVANKADYIIHTTVKSDGEVTKAKKVGEHYEFEMQLDISKGKSRVFIVNKKGSTIAGKSDQLNVNADEYRYFTIEEPSKLITFMTQRIDGKQYFAKGENPVEALLDIKSAVQLTEVKVSPLIKVSATNGQKGSDGTWDYDIVIDTKKLSELRDKASIARKTYQKMDESADNTWTDEHWKKLDQLKEEADNASNAYAEAINVTVMGKGTNRLPLRSDLIDKLTPKDKLVCNIDLLGKTDTVLKKATYPELLAVAKDRYKKFASQTESSYFDAARDAYDKAMGHPDCPDNIRETLRAERDTMASLRRATYLMELAEKKGKQFEKEKGFDCDEVYRYYGGVAKFAGNILRFHPEMKGIEQIRTQYLERLKKHPKGQNVTEETVIRQREQVSGTISFKKSYLALPFNKMRVYATNTANIKDGQSRVVGGVNSDGTYSIVKPDDVKPLYIYVTGEKDDAHYVAAGETHLDIVVE